ncbi:UNVERIFIED_CONTAM: hypothetical protein FKN15_003936 [Acipenser sinensis]
MALTSHNQLILSVYIVTFVMGLPANILAFYTFCMKVHRRPAPIDILLLNLTISDLIFLLFLPFRMVEVLTGSWVLPNFLCPLSGFVFYSTIYISTFFLMGVSVERYLGVAYPIKYKINHKPMYAIMASVFFWVISAAHCSIVYIVQYQKPGNGTHNVSSCYEEFTKEQLKILLPVRFELCLVLFCFPFLITSFCYINFIRILTTLPNISRRRKQRAIGLALGTLLVFILCFCPYNISHVLILSVYIVTFVTGLPTNILAFYTFCMKVRRKPAPIDILLLNLTISDLMFLLFLPFRMVDVLSESWVLPNFLCPLSGFIFYSTIYISTFFLMGVSVE